MRGLRWLVGLLVVAVAAQANAGEFLWPHIAGAGARQLLVWTERGDVDDPGVLEGRILDGTQPISPIRALATRLPHDGEPSLASDGSGYLVAWSNSDAGTISGLLVGVDGAVLRPPITISSQAEPGASVAFDGANYLVAWAEKRPAFDRRRALVSRVSRTGELLDPGGIPVSTVGFATTVDIAAANGESVLVYGMIPDVTQLGERLLAVHLGADARPIEERVIAEWSDGGGSIVSNGVGYLVVWGKGATRLRGDGSIEDASPLRMPGVGGYGPSLVGSERGYLQAWENPGVSIAITSAGDVTQRIFPNGYGTSGALAATGSGYVVVVAGNFTRGPGLYAMPLDASGGAPAQDWIPVAIPPGGGGGCEVADGPHGGAAAWLALFVLLGLARRHGPRVGFRSRT